MLSSTHCPVSLRQEPREAKTEKGQWEGHWEKSGLLGFSSELVGEGEALVILYVILLGDPLSQTG